MIWAKKASCHVSNLGAVGGESLLAGADLPHHHDYGQQQRRQQQQRLERRRHQQGVDKV
jgi:hypothetical protein